MKKIVCIVGVLFVMGQSLVAQKFQLTEAATEYKNNFSQAWMMQPDKLEQNKSTLQKAKNAIDECYNKQLEVPFTKSKDEAKKKPINMTNAAATAKVNAFHGISTLLCAPSPIPASSLTA